MHDTNGVGETLEALSDLVRRLALGEEHGPDEPDSTLVLSLQISRSCRCNYSGQCHRSWPRRNLGRAPVLEHKIAIGSSHRRKKLSFCPQKYQTSKRQIDQNSACLYHLLDLLVID